MRRLVIVLLLAACGDNSRVSQPDAVGPSDITLDLYQTPVFIRYRDGNGPWQDPGPPNAMLQYTIHVTGAYQVVAVCTNAQMPGGFDAEQLNATVADGEQFMLCDLPDQTLPATVTVSGTMNQAGWVSMYISQVSSPTAPWSFNLQATPGAHELVASGGGKMLVQRGLMIAGPMTVPTVDLATDGAAAGSATLAISGVQPGESLDTSSAWFTGNDAAELSLARNTVTLPPASLVAPGDNVQIIITAQTPSVSEHRDVFVDVHDVANLRTSYALPPILTGVSYTTENNTVTATWGSLPTYAMLGLEIFGGSSQSFQIQNVSATAAWMEDTQATTLAFDASPPGYSAQWQVALAGGYSRWFDVEIVDPIATSITGIHDSVGPATASSRWPGRVATSLPGSCPHPSRGSADRFRCHRPATATWCSPGTSPRSRCSAAR